MLPVESMKALLRERAGMVEGYLATCLDDREIQPRLKEAMRYSLLAGGKRLRPVLCLSTAALCGLEADRVLPFAVAIEMIHTYSLIHDDLPGMDDDDLRRGRPSNHKAFDVATAILAGDGLLTDAFLLMSRTPLPAERVLAAVREMALAAGSSGMVGGQEWDMVYTGGPEIGLEQLRCVHALKTGALLRGACMCGALLAGADDRLREAVAAYGAAFGVAFQIADDILDEVSDTATLGKPAGSDAAQGKMTYPRLVGVEKSRELGLRQVAAAQDALTVIDGPGAPDGAVGREAAFLRALVHYMMHRAA